MEQNNTNNLPAAYAAPAPAPAAAPASYFTDMALFEAGQRMAKLLCASGLVPQQFRNNIPDTLIALEMAARTGSSPLAVMQSMYVVHGRPSWSATFIIAAITSCGRFSPLRFEITGEGDDLTCRAWAVERASGEALYGPPVSIATAKREGWFSKQGSKWQTMPELMLHYRAATLFGRIYAADVLMGMKTDDEMDDIGPAAPAAYAASERMNGEAAGPAQAELPVGADAINALLDREAESAPEAESRPNPPEADAPPASRGKNGKSAAKSDLPPGLRKYIEGKEGPIETPKPEQRELPQGGEPEELAEYRAAAQRCIAEIDGLEDLTELKSWWSKRDYKRTVDSLGGMNSEWHQEVVEHLNARIIAVEAETKRR